MAVILDGIGVRVFPTSKKAQHYRNYDWHFKGCGYGNFLGKGISFVGWASLLLSLGLRVGSECGSSATKSGRVLGRLNSIAYSRFGGSFQCPWESICVALTHHSLSPLCFRSSCSLRMEFWEVSLEIREQVSADSWMFCLSDLLATCLAPYITGTCLPTNNEWPSRRLPPRELWRVLIADFTVCLTWGKTHYFLKSQLECVPWSL